jgi:hypothetical protein
MKNLSSLSILRCLLAFVLISPTALHAEVYIPDATLSLTGSLTVVETDQRLAFNANPNGGTPAAPRRHQGRPTSLWPRTAQAPLRAAESARLTATKNSTTVSTVLAFLIPTTPLDRGSASMPMPEVGVE